MKTQKLELPIGDLESETAATLMLASELARQKGVVQVQMHRGVGFACVDYDPDIVSPSQLYAAARRFGRSQIAV